MATRDVQIRLTTTGLDKAIASFDELSKKIGDIGLKIDDLDLKLDRLGAKKASPSVSVEGLDESLAKVAVLSAALDALGNKNASASVGSEGAASSVVRKALADTLFNSAPTLSGGRSDGAIFRAADALALNEMLGGGPFASFSAHSPFSSSDTTGSDFLAALEGFTGSGGRGKASGGAASGIFGRLFASIGNDITRSKRSGALSSLGGLGRIGSIFSGFGGGASAAAKGTEDSGGSLMSTLMGVPWGPVGIGTGIGLLASMAPALIPFGLGALMGGGGAFGAFKIASDANTQLGALQASLTGAQNAYKAAPNPGNYAKIVALQGQISTFQRKNAPALGLYTAGAGVVSTTEGLFHGALTTNALRSVPVTGPGHTTVGTAGQRAQQIGGTSFLTGIERMTGQVGSFMKSIGTQNLASTFQSTLPIIQTVIHAVEYFINLMGPIMTQAFQRIKPDLPIILSGFKELANGIGGFIKILGPGMRTAAIVFKTAMLVVRELLDAVAGVMDGLAVGLQRTGHFLMDFGKTGVTEIKNFYNGVKQHLEEVRSEFDGVITFLSRFFTQDIPNWIGEAVNWFGQLPGKIINALGSLPGKMLSIGENIIQGLINGIEHMMGGVVSAIGRIANAIPSGISRILHILSPSMVMHDIGMNIGLGLANGIDASHGHVMSSATNLARGIPGVVSGGSYAGRSAPLQLNINFNPSGGGDQISRAMMQILSHGMRISGGDPRLLISKVKLA